MVALSLKIKIVEKDVVKTIQFDPQTQVYDACRIIREKVAETSLAAQPKDYGIFLADEDPKKGIWLEPGKSLSFYMLKNGDILEYRRKMRTLRIRMLDGSVKTLMVDDSQPVANLMVVICTKIGIINHDEYSLVRELVDEEQENKPNFGTLTLLRRKEKEDRDIKMEQLKKKLKTDDEINWVDHSKTLRELGVEEHETLLLRRKFFFSDQNIDSRDPVQLNLLYVQARDAIIDGTHPVTQDKACEFAGIQCQIQFGDHVEGKHRQGFLDLRDFLPQCYHKVKSVEKKVFAEHKKSTGLNELQAKVRYVQEARSLRTYGVTFFLVKEKMKGKNKLVPRLLGVTKDAVLRLDEKTKEIMKTWPLTHVRRWAASPNTFTLDFGDYSDQYYCVQTTEGEQISQLIAGYIDIILKKQKSKDWLGLDKDEEATMIEDSVSPNRATFIQHGTSRTGKVETESVAKPAVVRPGDAGPQTYGTGHMQGAQYGTMKGQVNLGHAPPMAQQPKVVSVLTEPQKALVNTIGAGQDAVDDARRELDTRAQIPQLGTDPASLKWKQTTLDTNKQNVSSQIAAMNAATAQVVTLTSGPTEDVDHTAVGAAISTITSNLPDMTRGAKMIAALMDDDMAGDRLIDAARKLCDAFSDLMKAAEPESKEPRQNLLSAASRVGEASGQMLQTIGEDDAVNKEIQDVLLGLAKAVANSTAALVLKAKNVSSTCDDQENQNRVIGAATQCALSTSQLVAIAKVVAPTIQSPACQDQLIEAAKEVARAVEGVVQACQLAEQGASREELGHAAGEVTRALKVLLNHIKYGTKEQARETTHEGAVDTILSATDRLFEVTGDAGEMVRQARILAQATAQLIQAIKSEADAQPDSDIQRRLLAAAKQLADATANMVEAAKQCASHPHDVEQQMALRKAAEDLRNATSAAASDALRKKLIKRLENAAKHAAASATQCIAAAQGAGPYNSNTMSQEEMITACRGVADQIPGLVQGVKGTLANPDDTQSQLALINSCQHFIQPGNTMVSSVKSALPTVTDQASSLQLSNSSKQFSHALADLQAAAVKAQDACGSLEIDSAIQLIRELDDELEAFRQAAHALELRPLPGETPESAAQQLGSSYKAVGSNMARILTAASQRDEKDTGVAARDTAASLRELTSALRGVAATTTDRDVQDRMIDAGHDVMSRSVQLIEEARRTMHGAPDNQMKLAQAVKEVTQALTRVISCLPGQKDVDDVLKNIADASSRLSSGQFPSSSRSYAELQSELNAAAVRLNGASNDVVTAAKSSPAQLASSSRRFGSSMSDVLDVGMEMAGQTQEVQTRETITSSLRSVTTVSSKLLLSAKAVSADPTAPNTKNQLAAAARAVTESINALVNACTSATPGQQECDSAIRAIESLRPLLANPTEPVTDASYFECLDGVMDKSRSLGDGMTGIANHAKRLEHDQFGRSVRSVADSICGLVESAAQAAYLVGVSDSTSVAGRPGLVDQSSFSRAYQAIQTACQSLTNPTSNQQQVLSAATIIAKHTSALCNSCRVASSRTTNPMAKRQFVQAAKEVANSTANLVKEIKALDQDYSDVNRRNCAEATRPLLEAVDNLCSFAGSPEFASVPARISVKAQQAQEPITSAGEAIIDGSTAMISAAKSLAVNPKDPPTWQALANHSKSVSDSIKKLVSSIRDKAPGQKECDEAIERLSAVIRRLDQASLSAIDQSLAVRKENSLQGFTDQAQNAASELMSSVGRVRTAGRGEAEQLGHAVTQLASYFEPLANSVVGASSNIRNSRQQTAILDQTKTVSECALQLLYAVKEGGGNPKATHIHPDIDESAETMRDSLRELLSSLESVAAEAGFVSSLVETITLAMTRRDDVDNTKYLSRADDGFVDYQTRMVDTAKEIARTAQDMMTKSTSDAAQLGNLAANLTHYYSRLAQDGHGCVMVTSNADIANRVHTSIQELGQACVQLVKAGGACQGAPSDRDCQRDVADSGKLVQEKVSLVLAALQAGSRGTQACINAASTVSGIIGDLDTTIMFATAGTLHAETEDDAFSEHRENILKTAKALVEDTKTLVAGAASSQEQLAVAAQNAVATIVQLSEVVKLGAASLGANNPEAQVMLINAVKDVASALGDLIHATKSASGKGSNDPAMLYLKDSAKVMVTNVTSLLKTVKAVEDEHTRGTRALESTIEAIAQEIRSYESNEVPRVQAGPEDVIKKTKPVTLATAKAVAAGNSCKQDDVIVAANMGRKAISDLLTVTKAAAFSTESPEGRDRSLRTGLDTAIQYRELLQTVMHIISKPTSDARQVLPLVSRKIAQCVTELVAAAEIMKGQDWADPDDPTVIAENELLGAASSIDAAAKKLASLRPRRPVKEADESLNFDEMILEACKSIAAATSALVKAASAAQRELVSSGKVSYQTTFGSEDGQWSEGLISAARLVAAATHSLCEAANSLVQGHSSEEKLISSAKQVAGSTAQLLVACKVKASWESDATRRLQEAGNHVKRATDNLVRAAQQAIEQDEERSVEVNQRLVKGLTQEIDARSEVLLMERRLEDARGRLAAIRRAKYRGEDSDGEGYLSGYDSSKETSFLQQPNVNYSSPDTSPRIPTRAGDMLHNQSYDSSYHSSHSVSSHHTTTNTTTNTTQKTLNQSMAGLTLNNSSNGGVGQDFDSSIDDGPSFSQSLQHFRAVSGNGSPAHAGRQAVTSSSVGGKNITTAEDILMKSTQRMEHTITMSNSSRSYHLEQS